MEITRPCHQDTNKTEGTGRSWNTPKKQQQKKTKQCDTYYFSSILVSHITPKEWTESHSNKDNLMQNPPQKKQAECKQ